MTLILWKQIAKKRKMLHWDWFQNFEGSLPRQHFMDSRINPFFWRWDLSYPRPWLELFIHFDISDSIVRQEVVSPLQMWNECWNVQCSHYQIWIEWSVWWGWVIVLFIVVFVWIEEIIAKNILECRAFHSSSFDCWTLTLRRERK